MIERSKHYYDKDRNLPYKENTKETLRYFTLSEFDCNCGGENCKGDKMDKDFLIKLDEARHLANQSFQINSGMRCNDYQEDLRRRGYKTAKKGASPHLKGIAADISVTDSRSRWIVLNSLLLAGFVRIGIADTFIHVDLSTEKSQNVIWTY